MFVDGFIILFNCIPFIDSNDNTLAALMCDSGDLCILLGYTFGCIDHYNDHICPFNCCYGTNHAVTLNFFFDLTFTAKSCCVNKNVFPVFPFYFGIDCISGSSCDIRNDHSVFAQKFVDQRRFTYVWFTNHCNLRDIVIFFCIQIFREFPNDLIQHIADTGTVGRRNCYRLSDSKIIKFIDVHHIFLNAVNFIYNKNDWFLASAKHICHFCIRINKPLLHVCDKHNDIRSINRDLCLFSHL